MPNGGLQPFGVALVVENLPAYERAADRVSEAQENMGATADRAAESAGRLDLAYAAAGATLALIARKIVGTLQAWVMTAARVEELDEVLALAGQTAGNTRDEIFSVRDSIMELGITQAGSNQVLLQAIATNLSFEDTLKLVRRAQDLAVRGQVDSTATAIDLMRAISSGNVVLLRKYGILVSLRQEMRRGDVQTVKSMSELNAATRSQMMFSAIMRESEVYVGAYERAMEFASKQMRSWPRYIEAIRESFGEHLLPVLGFAVDKINMLLKGIIALPPELKAATTYGLAFTAMMLGAAGAVALFNTQFVGRFMVALKALPGLLLGLPNMIASALVTPWGLAAAAIGAFAIAVVFDIADMRSHFVATFQRMRIAVEAFAVAVRQIVSAILTTWETLSTNFQLVADQMYRVFVQSTAEITRTGQNLTETNFGIQFDPYRFAEGAASLMIGFAEGLVQGLIQILPVITQVVGAIASFFGGSLPERGPLADIVISGTELIRNYLRGMSEASLDDVAKIAEDIGEALAIPLFEASEAIRDLQLDLRDLDDALHPLELEIRKIEAAASLISIPLQRQVREMDQILSQLEEQERLQDAMAAERLAMLEDELSLLQEVIGADQSRLKVVQLQIELERKRLRESGRFDSEHLRSLMQQQGALKAGLIVQAARGEELESETEQARIIADEAKATESARLVLYRQERAALESLIAAEDERLRFAREEMVLAQARQIDQRIAFEEELTAWQRRQEEMDYYASLARKVLSLLKAEAGAVDKVAKAAKEYGDELDRVLQKVEDSKAKVKGSILDPARIAEMKKRIAEMMKPLLEEQLPQLRVEWTNLMKAWERMVVAIEVKIDLPSPSEVKASILKLFGTDMPQAIGEALFGSKPLPPGLERDWRGYWQPEAYTWGEIASKAYNESFLANIDWGRLAAGAAGLGGSIQAEIGRIDWGRLRTEGVKAFDALGSAIGRIDWQQLRTRAETALASLLVQLENLRQAFVSRLPQALALLGDVWDMVTAGFRAVADTILPPLQEAFLQISQAIQENLGPMLEALRGLWEALLPALAAVGAVLGVVLVAAIGVLSGVIAGLATGIAAAFPFIMQTITGVINVVTGILNLFVSTVSWIVAAISGDTEKMSEAWEKMKASVVRIVKGLWKAIKGVFMAIGSFVTETVAGFVNAIVGFFKNLYDRLVGKSILWDLYFAVYNLFTTLKKEVVRIFTEFRDAAVARALELRDRVVEWFEDLYAALAIILDNILTYAEMTWENIKTAVTTKAAEILAAAKKAFLDMKTAIETKLGEILAAIGTFLGDIIKALGAKKFLDSMVEIGKTIFQSLWDGLKKKAGKILEWIKNIAKEWIRGIKGFFGIVGDPYSLVFQGIGESLVTGLERGMEGFRPVLQAQVSALMAAVPERQAVPAPGRGAFGGNTYNTISGPTYQLSAQYSQVQSPATIRDDLALMTMIGM